MSAGGMLSHHKKKISSTHHFFLQVWIISSGSKISPWNTLPTTWWPQPSCWDLLQASQAFNLRPRWSETNTTSLRPLMIFGPKMWFLRLWNLDQHPPPDCKCQMLLQMLLQKLPKKKNLRDSVARYVLWFEILRDSDRDSSSNKRLAIHSFVAITSTCLLSWFSRLIPTFFFACLYPYSLYNSSSRSFHPRRSEKSWDHWRSCSFASSSTTQFWEIPKMC